MGGFKHLTCWHPLVEAPEIIRAGVSRVWRPQNCTGAVCRVPLRGGNVFVSELGIEGIRQPGRTSPKVSGLARSQDGLEPKGQGAVNRLTEGPGRMCKWVSA